VGRRLGQHFLTDRSILDRIVDAIDPQPDDIVIEIGPGRGTLTARLVPRVGRVVAIEKDRQLAEQLRAEYRVQSAEDKPPHLEIIEGDALALRWSELAGSKTLHSAPCTLHSFKVIGNIPYYITSPLIDKALTPPFPTTIVFLVQREFADRLGAEAGSKIYGALTAGVQAVAAVERLFIVRAGAFSPPPKVDSAVVRLTPRADPLIEPSEQGRFRSFLAAVFSQRRKQLGRSLRDVTGRSKEEVAGELERIGIDPGSRPEVLTPKELVTVFRELNR
jgi:16S rRNA (adenine1518-N6/adenine1519-N6)-dimethyltransferase